MKILATGGAGFVGSAVVRQFIRETDVTVVNADKLTYAGNLESLGAARDDSRHVFERIDICDEATLRAVFDAHRPDAVIHLAAESHVDRSIDDSSVFMDTNVRGTHTLLEVARRYWEGLPAARQADFRLLHVSTDEVYGDLNPTAAPSTESSPYAPSSPYAASKAASDHLVRAWHRTYGIPTLITNCSNNYGPFQFPEKLIPLMILNALDGDELPLYGSGEQIRDWLYVEDHARALRLVLARGMPGETYHVGATNERRNIEVVNAVCSTLNALESVQRSNHEALIRHVTDRPGHDKRYALDASKLADELGWKPLESFEGGLEKTVRWYLDNPEWCARVRSGAYRDWVQTNYVERGALAGDGA